MSLSLSNCLTDFDKNGTHVKGRNRVVRSRFLPSRSQFNSEREGEQGYALVSRCRMEAVLALIPKLKLGELITDVIDRDAAAACELLDKRPQHPLQVVLAYGNG